MSAGQVTRRRADRRTHVLLPDKESATAARPTRRPTHESP